jgi:hypothetical protein
VKPPYEQLSRLHAGDLGKDEAESLRRLMEQDPEARAAFEEIRAAVEDVALLDDVPPPAELDARVLGHAPRTHRSRRSLAPLVAGGLLAAAATVALLLRPGPPTVTLLEGSHLVEGRADVLAAGVPIAVDGAARVDVDPPHVSVSVTAGRARLTGPHGQLTISPGETHTLGGAGAGASAGVPKDEAARIGALERQVEELRQALAEAEFTSAVARGQLTASQGEPAAWPDDLPEAYRQEAFERNLAATIAELPGAEIHAVDCSEYPCIATLQVDDPPDGWEKQVEQYLEKLTDSRYPKSDTWMAIAKADADGTVVGSVGLAITPEYSLSEELRTRTQFRVTSLLGEIEHPQPEP